MLEHAEPEAQRQLLEELHTYTMSLVEDQYGNYVVQHVVEKGPPADRDRVVDIVRKQLVTFSRHKFASNVVEKCIFAGTPAQRSVFVDEILAESPDGTAPIVLMIKDQYANYVIQKLLDASNGADYDRLVAAIKPQLQALKKYSYGKHLVSIERLMYLSEDSNESRRPKRRDINMDSAAAATKS
jgi:hypothetical protein